MLFKLSGPKLSYPGLGSKHLILLGNWKKMV